MQTYSCEAWPPEKEGAADILLALKRRRHQRLGRSFVADIKGGLNMHRNLKTLYEIMTSIERRIHVLSPSDPCKQSLEKHRTIIYKELQRITDQFRTEIFLNPEKYFSLYSDVRDIAQFDYGVWAFYDEYIIGVPYESNTQISKEMGEQVAADAKSVYPDSRWVGYIDYQKNPGIWTENGLPGLVESLDNIHVITIVSHKRQWYDIQSVYSRGRRRIDLFISSNLDEAVNKTVHRLRLKQPPKRGSMVG